MRVDEEERGSKYWGAKGDFRKGKKLLQRTEGGHQAYSGCADVASSCWEEVR